MKKSIDTKKEWLANVKRARKMHEADRYAENEFDTNCWKYKVYMGLAII